MVRSPSPVKLLFYQPKALQTLFQFDLGLLSSAPVATIGGRVFARFDHGDEALAWRLYRKLRQLFLRQFSV